MGHEFWLCGYKCVQTTLFYLFLSKSNFMNPISYEGYPPSLRFMFCHQIKNMSTWFSPISTIVAPVALLLGHYKNLRLVSLWRREISHLEKEK